jgi:hypothetical protein
MQGRAYLSASLVQGALHGRDRRYYNAPPSRPSTNRVHVVMLRNAVAKLIRQSLLKVHVMVEKRTYSSRFQMAS